MDEEEFVAEGTLEAAFAPIRGGKCQACGYKDAVEPWYCFCAACGKQIAADIEEHEGRIISDQLMQAGLYSDPEPQFRS